MVQSSNSCGSPEGELGLTKRAIQGVLRIILMNVNGSDEVTSLPPLLGV